MLLTVIVKSKTLLLLLFANRDDSFELSLLDTLVETRKSQLASYLVLAWPFMTNIANAQDDIEAPLLDLEVQQEANVTQSYTPEDFSRFAPRNALDMLNQVPGFSVQRGDQGRGFGQANTNVLLDGQRFSSKSQGVFDQLRRVAASNVARIDIVDGATVGIPGLSGQVANVITNGNAVSGNFEYRTFHRPKYAEPGWFGGEVSISGTTPNLEWNAAYNHGLGRGAGAGPGIITDQFDNITERRDIYSHFEGDFPSLSGSLKWLGPNDLIANVNLKYAEDFTDFSNDEQRNLIDGVNRFRDFDNRGRGFDYEIGGDVEFGLGPGQLKLIGLERFEESDSRATSRLIFEDDTPTIGDRFNRFSETGERIARAEYRWDMLGGNWEVDLEAAYNELDRSSQLFDLDADGNFIEADLPNATGEVTEDRYEMLITHGRTLANGITMQLGVGGERSTLAQTGPSGLTRNFWRPKGSLNLSWTPREGMDLTFNVARVVDQLSFGQFLASVDLVNQNTNAGNADLRPRQSWETSMQIQQSLNDWGSTTLELFINNFDDYIDIIPLPGGGESQGNIDSAELYGIDWTSTLNLDPMGWAGVRVDLSVELEKSNIRDPLTGEERYFSRHFDRDIELEFRHDVPGTDWAWGLGVQNIHAQPSFRLSQVSLGYEGPTYTFGFIEHKNVFGLTANLNVFNLTDGRSIFERTVYDGLRTDGVVRFNEYQDLSVQPIFRFELTGNF